MTNCPDYRDPDAIRRFVMDFMHSTGARRTELDYADWGSVYLRGDGFGPVDHAFASRQLEWDWSHVRDSSDEAFLDMAAEIQTCLRYRVALNDLKNQHAAAIKNRKNRA
ncbi:unnamed protein product [marine sediment metagenome]|uniref:Uncharacterized protein n=1 Tax=marine sediment metagenome TaxID=412755 RepID=X0S2M2_9ZZZZ